MSPRSGFTQAERGFDALAHRLLARAPRSGVAGGLVEFAVFVVKQAWACLFGALMLAVLLAAHLWYPDAAPLARNDAITIAALVIQVGMLAFRLESWRELRVILTFHVVGTAMELFKTGVGSWEYGAGGVLHLGAVPLYSGFMYAAIGSYMVRVFRLFGLRFTRYPPRWITAIVAVAIYANFFTHHWIWDARYVLVAAVVLVWLRCTMHVRILRVRIRMPVLVAFALVAVFIWLAENIGTFAHAWTYPDQQDGWQLVSVGKLGSWFLLMIISVVLVTWVYRPEPPAEPAPAPPADSLGTVDSTTASVLASQHNDPSFPDLWEELRWRGLVHVSTDEEALRELLAGPPITYYCGFDPTAASLHLGNLVQLITMRRIQLAGHRPLGLVGGSTGLIGDPKPTSERTLNEASVVAEWVGYLQSQVSRFLSPEGDNGLRLVNNLDWTAPMSAIDFLREVGKHYRVGTMLKKDAVSARLNSDEGISYTEFSYQILQGLDFRELHRQYGCVLQTGGSDQWGNLTSGVDLLKRSDGVTAHAFGTPLITNSDGRKFGKSEGNAIWLDPALTSPYAMYQFWLNTDDADVIDRFKVFTFLTRAEIEDLAARHAEAPFRREAQRRLAYLVTELVHGATATDAAVAASEALFGGGDVTALDAATLESALRTLPHATASPEATVAQLLVDTGLSPSLSAARRAIGEGGVSVNGTKVDDEAVAIATLALASGMAVLRRGKKTLAGIFVG